jgi:energy-coupling factor transporter ATP-binding protein EcfA2
VIRRLYVNHFRCLDNFEFRGGDLHSILLVGKNGVGKSTFGQVLEIFQKIASGTNRVGDLIDVTDMSRGNTELPIRFEIEVLIGGLIYQYNLTLELPPGFRELRVKEEQLVVGGTVIYTRLLASISYQSGRLESEPARFPVDWHLIALPVVQAHDEGDPISVFRQWLNRMLILRPIPALITGESTRETLSPEPYVRNLGAWFTGLLALSPAAYGQIDAYMRSVLPDFVDIKNPLIAKDSRQLSLQFGKPPKTLSLNFNELSDGEKCFVICSLVLAANHSQGPVFCYWDEPDNFLALSEVSHFITALRRGFSETGQIIATSHNAEAINRFSDENTFLMDRASHLEPSTIRSLASFGPDVDVVGSLLRNEFSHNGH